MKFFYSRFLCTLFFFLLSWTGERAFAQAPQQRVNHAGKDFWLTTNGIPPSAKCMFYITGVANANITFTYTSTGTSQNYFLQGGTILKIQLNTVDIAAMASSYPAMEVVTNKSLHISSDTAVVVQVGIIGGATDDGTLLFPSDNQAYGNVFYLNGPRVLTPLTSTIPPRHGQFAIVSRCDSVVLEITPSQNTLMNTAGTPFNLVLHKGDSYLLTCGVNVRDLSGTKVRVVYASCCNPINIFQAYSANYSVFLPITLLCCADQMMEQILPVNVWDTAYALAGFRNNPYVVIKIVSAANNNQVYFDGTPTLTLNEGEAYDTMISNAVVITSDSLMSITQHMLSQSAVSMSPMMPLDSLSDPASLWVMPLRDGLKEGYIRPIVNLPNTPNPNFPPLPFISALYYMSVVTIISPAANISNVLVNSANITSQFTAFPNNPDYMYAHILMDTSLVYHIESPEKVFTYYYGAYAAPGSIAFPIGDIHPSNYVTTPLLTLEPDTVGICINGSDTLYPGHADVYEWSNGSTDSQIVVSTAGPYAVRAIFTDSCGKGFTKTYWVAIHDYDQQTQSDTIYKCVNETVTLFANPADSYLWFDGSVQQTFSTSAFGDGFSVIETDQETCTQTDHAFDVVPQPVDITGLNLGADTAMCPGEFFPLTTPYTATEWSDGTVSSRFIVTAPGIYWAMITDTCHDVAYRDTIVVRDSVCMKNFCSLTFPSAFSPNNDGRNDLFRPIQYGQFSSYYLAVYNRWGEKIYQSYKLEEGWNGMDRGKPAELGVYYYLCTYECPLKGNQMIKGEVTLVR